MTAPIGSIDDLEVFLGQRGTGKSTAMVARARQLAHRYGGAYIIGHSMGRRLPTKLPAELGGGDFPITYHASMKKLADGLRQHPERAHVLAPPMELEVGPEYYRDRSRETADDVLRYAVKLSTHLRIAAYRKEHPLSLSRDTIKLDFEGLPMTPIIVLVDEGVAVEGATKKQTGPERQEFFEFLFSLRHLHIILLWSIQDPTAKGWMILGQATLIHIFHTQHEYALQAIRAAGASEDQLEEIRELYAYESVTIRVSAKKRKERREPLPQEKADVKQEQTQPAKHENSPDVKPDLQKSTV